MILDIIFWLLISFGAFLLFSSSLAIMIFPDPYMKIHAGSKASYGGAVILLGFILKKGFAEQSALILLVMVFILVTSPILGHALGRAAYLDEISTDKIKQISYRSKKDSEKEGNTC